VIGDVRDDDLAVRSVQAATWLGPVATLVNNAGIADRTPFEGVEWDAWWSVFEVNVRATAVWSGAVLPAMQAHGGGRIINVSSPGAFVPLPFYSAYCPSKAAISQLTKCLSVELHAQGVKFFALGPKAWTDLTQQTTANPNFPPAMEAAFRTAFESDADGDLQRSLAVFRVLVSGAADHLSGEYFGDQGGTFDSPADLLARTRDPRADAFTQLLASS
jgi:NAD(P)-dependent dehydrogenase (short-subunit alcohol dehydrogenase family)